MKKLIWSRNDGESAQRDATTLTALMNKVLSSHDQVEVIQITDNWYGVIATPEGERFYNVIDQEAERRAEKV